jgi:peptidoglycan hydrolase-like protein with peptidoglycan-binding domain
MTSGSVSTLFWKEAKLLGYLYPAAVVLGICSAFVSTHTGLKIVTSGPPDSLTTPSEQRHPLPPEQIIWEFGFPEPASRPPPEVSRRLEPIAEVQQPVANEDHLLVYAPPKSVDVQAALTEKRVAFVAGNGAYKNVAQLPNPPVDAKAMASALRNVGFDVIEGTNLTHDAMTEKLLEFGKKAQGADVAVFFYAGHGMAINGTNYLLPVDADIKSEMDVKLGAAININLTLDQTMSDAKVKLVFLDACRDDPFAARIKSTATRSVSVESGLAEMKSGEGTLIAFATGPGQTALDGQEGTSSPFTRALIDHITKPGIEIQQAMTEVRAQVNEETNRGQLPWGHTNLIGSVFLNPTRAEAAMTNVTVPALHGTAKAVVASTAPGTDVELEYWRSVKETNKPEELNAYLSAFPNGQFKALALARLAAIENGPSTTIRNLTTPIDPATFTDEATQVTEDQIGLEKGQRKDVQRRLNDRGFDTKVTGKFDDDTRSVIKRWQAARGYPVSGYLNKFQYKALLGEIVATTQTSSGDSEDHPARHSSGGGGAGGRHYRSSGGRDGNPGAYTGGVMGGMMGGTFRH